jgi:hypothetical protein
MAAVVASSVGSTSEDTKGGGDDVRVDAFHLTLFSTAGITNGLVERITASAEGTGAA